MTALIKLKHVKKYFPAGKFPIQAVDGIDLEIREKQTLGLVGESGCGKSTIGKMLVKLLEPTSGDITYRGIPIQTLKGSLLKSFRSKVQMIFQDPYSSLNPRMTIEEIVKEPFLIHQSFLSHKAMQANVYKLLELVGLDPSIFSNRFPHEFSGGQRQRVGIARAIALNPEFIVCDEPIAALDVSIQAQIINLLQDLQKQLGLTYLFISHDLAMIKYICQEVAVMYLGHIVEFAKSEALYKEPLHPYTYGLLGSIASPDPELEKTRQHIVIKGEIPSPRHPPKGCVFCTRCPKVMTKCLSIRPKLKEIAPGRLVSCHLYSD